MANLIKRAILLGALVLPSGCEDPLVWDLSCQESAGDVLCAGTLEGVTMRVVAPSLFSMALDTGRYVDERAPSCAIDAFWDDVVCYTPAVSPDATVCMGHSVGILVPSSDPCADAPAGYVGFHGLHVWPDPDADLDGISVPWPG
jgi:hypothetical protein